MSKHLGLLTKVDNTGTKWYRRVLNVGDTAISAGCLVEASYDSHATNGLTLTGHPTISCDYNLCRLISGDAEIYNSPVSRVLGVACQDIIQRAATPGDERYYDGWVQYKGAAQVSCREVITANTVAMVASSTTSVGHGCCMMTAAGAQAASGSIGMCLCSTGATGANDLAWIYLWLN